MGFFSKSKRSESAVISSTSTSKLSKRVSISTSLHEAMSFGSSSQHDGVLRDKKKRTCSNVTLLESFVDEQTVAELRLASDLCGNEGRKSCLKKVLCTNYLTPSEVEQSCAADPAAINSVSFDVVEVRVYVPSISLNPTVKDGIAVELGWEVKSQTTLFVEEFESARPPVVENLEELLLTQEDRLRILRTSGHTMGAIQKAMDKTRKGRNQRIQTLKKLRNEDRKFEGKMKKLHLSTRNDTR
jgi:hypothetical protein